MVDHGQLASTFGPNRHQRASRPKLNYAESSDSEAASEAFSKHHDSPIKAKVRRPKVTKRRSTAAKARSSSTHLKPEVSVLIRKPVTTRQSQESIIGLDDDSSSLSSLSSGSKSHRDIPSPSKRPRIDEPRHTDSKGTRSNSDSDTVQSRPSSSTILPTEQRPLPIPAVRVQPSSKERVLELGSYVFVKLLIAPHGTAEKDRIHRDGTIWWPAQVSTHSSRKLTIQRNEQEGMKIVLLDDPSPNVVLSYIEPTTCKARFTFETANLGRPSALLKIQWMYAIGGLDADDPDDNGEPSRRRANEKSWGSDDEAQAETKRLRIDKERRKQEEEAALELDQAHATLGQLVISKIKPGCKYYWPGKVREVVASTPPALFPVAASGKRPSQKKTPLKFKVQFFDGATATVTRDMFFTRTGDDELDFATKPMGSVKTVGQSSSSKRPPERIMPAPTGPDFTFMPLSDQMRYVEPILLAIIHDEYKPLSAAVDQFYKDGLRRIEPVYGSMAGEADAIITLVDDFVSPETSLPSLPSSQTELYEPDTMLPASSGTIVHSLGSGPSELEDGFDDTGGTLDDEPGERDKQVTRFEKATPRLRKLFVTDILAPHAALQLILWRRCLRTVAELQNPSEEQDLYERGVTGLMEEPNQFNQDLYREAKDARELIRSTRAIEEKAYQAMNTMLDANLVRKPKEMRQTMAARRARED